MSSACSQRVLMLLGAAGRPFHVCPPLLDKEGCLLVLASLLEQGFLQPHFSEYLPTCSSFGRF